MQRKAATHGQVWRMFVCVRACFRVIVCVQVLLRYGVMMMTLHRIQAEVCDWLCAYFCAETATRVTFSYEFIQCFRSCIIEAFGLVLLARPPPHLSCMMG